MSRHAGKRKPLARWSAGPAYSPEYLWQCRLARERRPLHVTLSGLRLEASPRDARIAKAVLARKKGS